MSSKTASENNSPSQLVPTNETVVDKHPTTGAPTAAVQNEPSVPIKTTTVNTADPVLQKERGSVGNTVPGSEDVRALGSIFGGSPKKPPTMAPPMNVTIAKDQPLTTAGPDSQENETLGSTDTLVADLISGIQTVAADGKVELLKKLLNDLKSSTATK